MRCLQRICICAALITYIITVLVISNILYDVIMPDKKIDEEDNFNASVIPVEVWGKASISVYFWEHIFKGKTIKIDTGYNVGKVTTDKFEFNFRNGPSVTTSSVPYDVEYLVLILNGRAPEKITFAKTWLNFSQDLWRLKYAFLVLLGNEKCNNDWILPYMKSGGGHIDKAFIVYDTQLVDDKEFFQWPLGVAEYRGFPDVEVDFDSIELYHSPRPWKANFVGTVYKGSSREYLAKFIENQDWSYKVFLDYRTVWKPKETNASRTTYMNALKKSDLTLNPVGMNSECYRIYEAMSYGSVPVVEDIMTDGNCDSQPPAPFRLLKKYNAPILWINHWADLPDVLYKYENQPDAEILRRRLQIVFWYQKFKVLMKERFIRVLKNTIRH